MKTISIKELQKNDKIYPFISTPKGEPEEFCSMPVDEFSFDVSNGYYHDGNEWLKVTK